MSMEQELYSQVVLLCRKYLKFGATDKNRNGAKLKFQGQSARSKPWLDLHIDWIEVNFSTREPDFYKKKFQSYANT